MSDYKVPKATVKALKPRGFEVSIPDEPGITLFAFHGKLNEPIKNSSDQTWAVDVVRKDKGLLRSKWSYTNRDANLNNGDVLHYWITVKYNGLEYYRRNQTYKKSSWFSY